MLSKDLELNLNAAFKGARARRHEFMTVEHLLLALLDNDAAGKVLRACGADVIQLRGELTEFVETTTPVIPQEDAERETEPTLGFQRVLQRAVFHVQSSGRNEVTGANVLVALFSEQESQAVYLLKKQNIARIDVVNYITHGISKVSDTPRPDEPLGQDEQQEEHNSEDDQCLQQGKQQRVADGAEELHRVQTQQPLGHGRRGHQQRPQVDGHGHGGQDGYESAALPKGLVHRVIALHERWTTPAARPQRSRGEGGRGRAGRSEV